MILLENDPLPDPSEVLSSFTVGSPDMFQHTPRDVMPASPSSVMLPPDTAVVGPEELITAVVRVAISAGSAVKETSLPYEIPMLLTA